ncbi:MAG: hypothetical protein J6K42_04710 [Clostridia bacterium]|nr:hypothetical protein [Clostridia bacterium]
MNEKITKITKITLKIIAILSIAIFAYSLTPKTFQNDTFYTIKIGEHIVQNTEKITDLLPWNKGLDMQDPFSFHKDLPYTYPHWLYDVATYGIYAMAGFKGIYYATCILAIILGVLIYSVNLKFTKNNIISYVSTILSLYCLKNFITARAQLLTFILFVLTIFGIEQFLKTKKIRYAVLLIIIPIIIANVHSAVWPFYFVLYLPYIVEYLIYIIATTNYSILFKKISLCFNSKFGKNKLSPIQADLEKNEIKKLEKTHEEKLKQKLGNLYKLKLEKEKNIKWLILILIICVFTGLLTPIKDTPYTYLIKTNQGNTTQNISEHLPLTLINNSNMMVILMIIFGVLIFTKTKIKLRDFFMLMGLILLSFMSQRQVSMLVLIGNFIVAKMIAELVKKSDKKIFDYLRTEIIAIIILICVTSIFSVKYCKYKKNEIYVYESSYPVLASDYLINELIPSIGKENLKLYNEYNYGSYLLFRGIPVFIDSRADLYTPEFNGEKDENDEYVGRDIFTDFLDISSLSTYYENKFSEYGITHVMTYSNSKLNSLLKKDENYAVLYEDSDFVIYKRESIIKVNI